MAELCLGAQDVQVQVEVPRLVTHHRDQCILQELQLVQRRRPQGAWLNSESVRRVGFRIRHVRNSVECKKHDSLYSRGLAVAPNATQSHALYEQKNALDEAQGRK